MTTEQFHKRMAEFPGQIRIIAQVNPAVAHCARLYGEGEIITLTEALCQMVVAMDKDWSADRRRGFEYLMESFKYQIDHDGKLRTEPKKHDSLSNKPRDS